MKTKGIEMKRKIKLTYIFSHHIRWVAFEWAAKYIDRSKFEIDFIILREDDPMIDFLKRFNIPYKATSYTNLDETPEVVKFIYDHLVANQTDVVHTHFTGDLPGLQAAYFADVPVRIHTTHHAGVKWKRHPRSRYELFWALSTNIIAITVRQKEGMISDGVPEHKITVIPHGFDIKEFEDVAFDRIEKLRTKYLNNHSGPVIGVASRYIEVKGIKYIIEAHKKVLSSHPNATLVLSGTHADNANIKDKLAELPPHSYVEIYFEDDLFALFRLFDVFVHVPIHPDREAFGQVYIEAMLSEVPSVITRAGIAHEYALHKENAWIVDYKNSEQIVEGILALLQDKPLRKKIIKNALACAKNYRIENQNRGFEELYLQQLKKMNLLK